MSGEEVALLHEKFNQMAVEITELRKDVQYVLQDRSRVREWITAVSVAVAVGTSGSAVMFVIWTFRKIEGLL
jgi:nitrogen fixation/metabolism regulation signal transduction histidine kinase